MADKFLNNTGLTYYHNRIKTLFADKTEVADLDTRVDALEAAGGEENVIETVKVNGTALVPDAQKAVDVSVPTVLISADPSAGSGRFKLTSGQTYAQFDIDPETNSVNLILDDGEDGYGIGLPTTAYLENVLPTKTSDLTNDGDGASPFATQAYVQQNGGKIDTISVNDVQQTITNKNVNITVPTVVSDLTNDSGYQNATQVQTAIDNALEDITGIEFRVVQTLPATGEKGVIYLVPNSGSAPNVYDEYIWTESSGMRTILSTTGTVGSQYRTSYLLDVSYDDFFNALKGSCTYNSGTSSYLLTDGVTVTVNGVAFDSLMLDDEGVEFYGSGGAGNTAFSVSSGGTAPIDVLYTPASVSGTVDVVIQSDAAGGAFEKIGSTDVDLSQYWAKADLVAITTAEIDTILAS